MCIKSVKNKMNLQTQKHRVPLTSELPLTPMLLFSSLHLPELTFRFH